MRPIVKETNSMLLNLKILVKNQMAVILLGNEFKKKTLIPLKDFTVKTTIDLHGEVNVVDQLSFPLAQLSLNLNSRVRGDEGLRNFQKLCSPGWTAAGDSSAVSYHDPVTIFACLCSSQT